VKVEDIVDLANVKTMGHHICDPKRDIASRIRHKAESLGLLARGKFRQGNSRRGLLSDREYRAVHRGETVETNLDECPSL